MEGMTDKCIKVSRDIEVITDKCIKVSRQIWMTDKCTKYLDSYRGGDR